MDSNIARPIACQTRKGCHDRDKGSPQPLHALVTGIRTLRHSLQLTLQHCQAPAC